MGGRGIGTALESQIQPALLSLYNPMGRAAAGGIGIEEQLFCVERGQKTFRGDKAIRTAQIGILYEFLQNFTKL
jgi:hypothetical protein